MEDIRLLTPFRNEPNTDFSQQAQVEAFRRALDTIRSGFGKTYPMVIDGRQIVLDQVFSSINPACPTEVLGQFADGTAEHADMAVEAAAKAFETWRHVPAEDRSRCILRAAAAMRRRKIEFAALAVLEAGKNWGEADGEVCEAIDFMEYYARQMLRIADSSAMLGDSEGEELQLAYIPLGVGAVIPPWNFPNALLTGLVSAALVTGNTVVLKPAEQTPLVGYKVAELFWQAGVPAGVLNFITGPGDVVGERMVQHPKTRFIAFTGSREVGVGIYSKAATVHPGQKWLKRTILEMGGKNAVIVDETADLDAAAQGIVTSAFSFQGQKCSAGSRAVIVDSVYETVAQKVVTLTSALIAGTPDASPDIYIGPVIDADAFEKVTRYIDIGKGEGELLAGGNSAEDTANGYFIEPSIFGDVQPFARIAQEEIFGPVLALIRARDFDDALRIANDTDFGLTGSVYSSDRKRLSWARHELHVGNLYFNRKCTGSMVSQTPFGGFNMSGTDSKAGGPDYLLLFTQAKAIAEKF
jgi:1-pyrroline-5-carboxylate dehydrogenase